MGFDRMRQTAFLQFGDAVKPAIGQLERLGRDAGRTGNDGGRDAPVPVEAFEPDKV